MDTGRDLYMNKMFRRRHDFIYAQYIGGHFNREGSRMTAPV